MVQSQVREQPVSAPERASAQRDILPGVVLVVIGVWVAAQVLLGDLPGRVLAWQAYFGQLERDESGVLRDRNGNVVPEPTPRPGAAPRPRPAPGVSA